VIQLRRVAAIASLQWSAGGSTCTVATGQPTWICRGAANSLRRWLLHKEDKDDALFFCVAVRARVAKIFGCLHAREGKLPEFWADRQRSGRWAYFVPIDRLQPVPSRADLPAVAAA
jgi:hypothetical protein